MTKLFLSTNDRNLLDIILQELSDNAKYSITIEGLLRKWQSFVQEVTRGYSDSIYEYQNDLSAREILQTLISKTNENIANYINSHISDSDVCFKESTRIITKSLRNKPLVEDNWWWYRIPKKMKGDIEKDLLSEGIIE